MIILIILIILIIIFYLWRVWNFYIWSSKCNVCGNLFYNLNTKEYITSICRHLGTRYEGEEACTPLYIMPKFFIKWIHGELEDRSIRIRKWYE